MNKLHFFGEDQKPLYESPSMEIMNYVSADVLCGSGNTQEFNNPEDVDWFN